jgi:hypothetical protein
MSDSTVKKSGRLARVLKVAGLVNAVATVVVLVAHFVWTSSGSNEWRLASDKRGIKVWTLKSPGQSLLSYKVHMHVDSRLSDVVFYLSDLKTGADVGAFDIRRLEQVSAPPLYYVYDTYKLKLPRPFGLLEVMIVNQYRQDPVTKQVTLNVYAAPGKRPLQKNITRVVHLGNTWTLTPVESGGVDVESVLQMDLGTPYVLANLAMPSLVDEEFDKMRATLKKDKFKNRTPAFISEPYADQKVAAAGDVPAPAILKDR